MESATTHVCAGKQGPAHALSTSAATMHMHCLCAEVLSIMAEDMIWRRRFNDLLATFLGLGTFQLRCCLCRVRKLSYFIKNILICVLKMIEGLMGLEHEGE